MKTPYNRLHARGNILFAARSGKIHTFNLQDNSFISTWTHPAAVVSNKTDSNVSQVLNETPAEAAEISTENEPPSKRQKVSENATDDNDATRLQTGADNQKDKAKGPKERQKTAKDNMRLANVPDRPVIIQLTSTEDGAHVVAVTGHDKAIWVFEHDGKGNLKKLSSRIMPKRPSSIIIAPDSQIICADKFGDVYSLPILVSEDPVPKATVLKQSISKPAATTLTVHSKGNRQALANQQRQIELAKGEQDGNASTSEEPAFELTLLLGHVSMLTNVTLGESDGRKYLLTADRDEHIRVSRFIPQTHVIHGYCLGHNQFIGDMVIPTARKDILISGGGDENLFVWDWVNGKYLSKADVLASAKTIAPDATNVAISGLRSLQYTSESGSESLTYIIAICEGLNAILSWQLTDDNTLKCPSIIQLPGNPLDVIVCPSSERTLAVALDPVPGSGAKCVHIFQLTSTEGRLSVDVESVLQDDQIETNEAEVSSDDIRSLLYTVETLRKQVAKPEEDDAVEETHSAQ